MSDVIREMDNILSHVEGINDERDSVPLLLAVREQWPKVKAEIERLEAEIEHVSNTIPGAAAEIVRLRKGDPMSRQEMIEQIIIKIMKERSQERMALPEWEGWLTDLLDRYEEDNRPYAA